MEHPSGIPEKIVKKVVARRGRLHAFEVIEARTTALVVIDLDDATVSNNDAHQRVVTDRRSGDERLLRVVGPRRGGTRVQRDHDF